MSDIESPAKCQRLQTILNGMAASEAKLPEVGLPINSRARKHEKQNPHSYFPNPRKDQLPKRDNKRTPAPKISSWVKANPKTIIDESLLADFRSDDWAFLAHHPDPKSFSTLLCYYPQEKRDLFESKLQEAKKYNACILCVDYKMAALKSGYIQCKTCRGSAHQLCAGVNLHGPETTSRWNCQSCDGAGTSSMS